MRILFTDSALPTIQILGKVSPSPYNPKITVTFGELHVYFAVQILPFIDWTWTAEMTLSLQMDLVLSDAASTSEVGITCFNWCCHFAYGDAAMWLRCVRHPKNAIFMQNLQWVWPLVSIYAFHAVADARGSIGPKIVLCRVSFVSNSEIKNWYVTPKTRNPVSHIILNCKYILISNLMLKFRFCCICSKLP